MRWCVLAVTALSALAPTQANATASSAVVEASTARINVEFQDADLRQVLRTFAELGRINIIVEQGVSGRVTATFRSTTWQEALAQVLRSQGLEAERDGNVIYVRPGC